MKEKKYFTQKMRRNCQGFRIKLMVDNKCMNVEESFAFNGYGAGLR